MSSNMPMYRHDDETQPAPLMAPHFQAYLRALGYQIEPDNPIFTFALDLFLKGDLYEVIPTDFFPLYCWNIQAETLLEPYKLFTLL